MKIQNLGNYSIVLIASFIFVLFFINSFIFLDPDFGWHLEMGDYILKSGIPRSDPFSYTMPSFPFVDHEWLTDVGLFYIYENIGILGLSVFSSLIATLAIIFPFVFLPKKYNVLPILLAAGYFLSFVAVRPQLITLFLFSLLTTMLINRSFYVRFKFFLPLVFLIWANLHGGFAIGISVFALFVFVKTINAKKIDLVDLFLITVSVFFTFINPYGLRLWEEIYRSMSDSGLRWTISEWRPAFLTFHPVLIIAVVISSFLLFRYRKKFSMFEKLLFLGLLFAGISSVRHMPFWIIVSSPILLKGILFLEQDVSKIKHGKDRFKKAYIFLLAMSLVMIFTTSIFSFKSFFIDRESNIYPDKAILYLRNNETNGRIFSLYGWGGYLIWRFPEQKVFIDGRMPSWKQDHVPEGESTNAFQEYIGIFTGEKDISEIIIKYRIDTFLLSPESEKNSLLKSKNNNKTIYTQLEMNDFNIVYEDESAVIYRKNN